MRLAVVLGLLALAGCRSRTERAAPPAEGSAAPRAGARRPHAPAGPVSTIAARDYVGPEACGECHPDQHARWTASLHRVMNQRADGDGVLGDFDGAIVPYAGGEARFAKGPAGYTMTLAKHGREVRYRVTRTIGKRALQEYVGVEDGRTDEVRLPFGWWPRGGGWYPQPYFDPWLAEDRFDAYAPVREPWAERCPWCHSTYPFEQRIARATARDVGHGLEQHFVAAGAARDPAVDRLAVATQVTVGISCESCHLGGRAHAEGAPIHLVPQGAEPRPGAPVPTTFAEERGDPRIVNTTCAQCHSGPSPRLPDGAALRNSSEALDLAASPCTAARCTDCHDPHAGGASEARAIAACTACHETIAAGGRAHTGHEAAAGVSCLDCHMPRIVMGVDRFVRTHRISSPGDPRMLAAAAPNACNLCHLDRSIRWTAEELGLQHDVRVDPRSLGAYGDVTAPVGEVWLASEEPAIRLIAGAAYARAAARGLAAFATPALRRGLADPLAHVRAWTVFAIEDAFGRRLPRSAYDPRAPAAVRTRQLEKLRVGP